MSAIYAKTTQFIPVFDNMAHAPDDQQSQTDSTGPPYPTFEAIEALQQGVRSGPNSMRHVVWLLDGPLETAVSVMGGGGALEPYYNPATGQWHPIGSLPVSDPLVSSITVHVDDLFQWEGTWDDMHIEHAEASMFDEPDDWCAWGLLEDNDDGELDLLRCCGLPRPIGKDVTIVVQPTNTGDDGSNGQASNDGSEGGFVTLHDYLSVVHPWLMSLRSEILAAMGALLTQDVPLPDTTELVVRSYPLNYIGVEKR